MDTVEFLDIDLFQGIATLLASEPRIMFMRVFLILLGFLLIYLGRKGVLEALLMMPMGLGMAVINAGVLFWDKDTGRQGTLFLDPLASDTDALMGALQIDWLQPVYNFTFSNGLIACVVLLGVGVLLDVGFVLARPFKSMFIALCAELGTVLVFPIALWWGLPMGDAAAIATIGGADGPMILFTALILSPELFVPITVVAYLYLGLTYGGYPYLIRLHGAETAARPADARGEGAGDLVVRRRSRSASSPAPCCRCCFRWPRRCSCALFLGVIIRESELGHYVDTIAGPLLYGATFFLGLLLGVLCEANTLLDPKVFTLLVLGILALLLSGIGGILGGYVLYFATGGKFNPVIGIAGVSCVPTTAKVAQKCVAAEAPSVVVLPHALGASISGVITSAIFASIFISLVQKL